MTLISCPTQFMFRVKATTELTLNMFSHLCVKCRFNGLKKSLKMKEESHLHHLLSDFFSNQTDRMKAESYTEIYVTLVTKAMGKGQE